MRAMRSRRDFCRTVICLLLAPYLHAMHMLFYGVIQL